MQTGFGFARHHIIDWHTNLKMPEFASNEAEFNSRILQHMREIRFVDEHVADTAESSSSSH